MYVSNTMWLFYYEVLKCQQILYKSDTSARHSYMVMLTISFIWNMEITKQGNAVVDKPDAANITSHNVR